MKLEMCIDSVESALAAKEGGADRVELCAGLLEGGITPSAGMIKAVRERFDLGLQVIIRPRGGDFLYSDDEVDVMLGDVETAKNAGADGVVIGCLLEDGSLDLEKTKRLLAQAGPMNVTFHRAFDMSADPEKALEQLIDLGITRVLTSGQEPTVLEGADLIASLVTQAAGRIVVMPGGGVTPRNISKIIALTGVEEIHVGGGEMVESGMRYRNPRVFMGGTLMPPEYSRTVASKRFVGDLVNSLGSES